MYILTIASIFLLVLTLFNIITLPVTTLLWTTGISFLFEYILYPLFYIPYHRGPVRAANHGEKRRSGKIPPPFPNGWFKICDAHELPKGKAMSVNVLGQFLAIYRGEDGKVYALDAYCPHLGANLGLGKVCGNSLECPFHGWKFDGQTGKCIDIPYNKGCKIPDIARTKPWKVAEINKLILLYHDAEDREPTWTPPIYEQIHKGNWVFAGKVTHYISCHVQEVFENGADVAHLNVVHTESDVPIISPLCAHVWEARWEPSKSKDEEHIAYVNVKEQLHLFGFYLPGTTANVTVRQIGPGLAFFDFKNFPFIKIFQSVTPVEPLMQKVEHVAFAPRWAVPLAKIIVRAVCAQVDRDVSIWNTKKYLPNPVIAKHDGPIPKLRRWFSKFYSEKSLTYKEILENSLEW